MKKEYLLSFYNADTGKKMILEHYSSMKEAYERANAWNELNAKEKRRIYVTVKIKTK